MKTADRPGRRGRRRLGIKWKLLVYLLCFVAVMLGCLWLFQVVFLESFYKSIKEQNLKDCRAQVVRQLARQESPEDFLATLALKEGVAAAIYTTQGQLRYSVVTSPGETITRLGSNTIDQLAAQIEASGEILFVSAPRLQYKSWMAADDGGGYLFGKSKFPTQLSPPELNIQPRDSTIDNIQTLILGTAVSLPAGEEGYLFLSTALTPVSTTTQTLQVQLIYISLLLVALSAVLALFLSRRITSPIVSINQTARELAEGNYSVTFHESGYREAGELAETLNYAAGELSKVEHLRRELVANISHDLRTPLTLIAGYAEMMRDLPGENTPENLNVILEEVNRMSSLVTDVLDLSQLEAGAQKLTPTRFSLTELGRETVERLGALLAPQGYRLIWSADREAQVQADENKIYQVLYNLVNNAVTYTGADKAVFVSQTVREGMAYLQVRDTGKGIAPDDLPYIWDRYYKQTGSHKRPTVGTGLGLSIVKGVLELHQLPYGVESSSAGTTFWFAIPLAEGEAPPAGR